MAGRPREFDRDEALIQARNLFWERGYEGASMADLVQATGLASARIYWAFGSKEALFREAVANYEAGAGGFVGRALAEEPTLRAALSRMFDDAIDLYTAPSGRPLGCMVVSAAVNCSSENAHIRGWLEGLRRRQRAAIQVRFERAQALGELGAGTDVVALATLCDVFMQGLSAAARDGVEASRLRSAAEALLPVLVPPP